MSLLLLCIIGYLVGSIPSGFVLAKFCLGIDLRKFGSTSTGATNVLRTGNKKLALTTLLMDGLKGLFFTLIVKTFFADSAYHLIPVFCCILGHTYPVWLKFKGGKGVATSAGIFVILAPVFALISIALWALTAKVLKISSLASLVLSFSFAAMCCYGLFFSDTSLEVFVFAVTCFAFLLLTHVKNILRLIHHEESLSKL